MLCGGSSIQSEQKRIEISNSIKLVEMLLDNKIEDLLDDGFEGSQVEQSIFREIFFRNDIGSASKKCLVTGAINFECESGKNTATSLCSNSENSVLTSHSSSRNTYPGDFSVVTEACRETSELEIFPKTFASEKRNGQKASSGRIRSLVHKLSNVEPDLGNASSAFQEKNASRAFYPVIDPEVVTLRLVECSSQGLISSCYLLKQHGGMVKGCRLVDPNVSKCRSQNLEGNDAKEAIIGKAIASPASQESFASRLLAASPNVNVQERSESPLHAEERPQEHQSFELDLSDVVLKKNLKKDPRQLLQYHVVELLRAAGWRIERRKRPSRQYLESVYRTPKGRPVREFAKAWRLCGELLSAYRCNLVEKDDGKEWSNIGQFLSDLSDTLVILEKDTNHSELASRWRLLDPFVIVAFINRKIGALRKGEVVKATQSLVADRNRESDVLLLLTNTDSVGHQIAKGDPSTSLCGSALADESALVFSEGNFNDCCQQYGNGEYNRPMNDEAVKFLKGMLLCTAKEEGMLLVNASNEFGDLRSLVSGDQTSSLDMTSFAAHGTGATGSTVLHSANCQISDKQSSDCNVETIREVNSFDNKDELLGRQINDIGNYLLTSRDYYPNNKSDALVPFQDLEAVRHLTHVEEDNKQQYEVSELTLVDTSSPGDVVLKKKTCRKSKRISEMEPISLNQSGNQCLTLVDEVDFNVNGNDIHLESNQDQGDLVANENVKGTRKKSSYLKSSHHQMEKKGLKLKRNCSDHTDSKIVKKKSARCRIEDDDLLVSAIIKNKDFISSNASYTSRKKACKSRAQRKLKSQKHTCRLLPSLVNGGKHFKDGKWYSVGVRTVLSWLIGSGAISLNDVIQYRNPKDGVAIKDGVITRDGILCKCCNKLLTVSAFKIHAGFKLNRPCLNLFMGSGEPFTLCLLEAWSAEYKTRKGGSPTVQIDENDQNDDSCGLCGDGGELICCDNCPSTFHRACLSAQDLPEGSWYCPNCTCWICGSLVNEKEVSSASDGFKCSQCEHKYHEGCLKQKGRYQEAISDSLFCGRSCQEVYHGLQSRVGVINHVADGFSWVLLKCIHDDQKVRSAQRQRFALKAECNSRLAVALTIMEECFLSMVDPRTGIDMIPHVLYNWGSEFARLNFQGFYTVVLEKNDVLISVASIRVHGTTVAEMPLIATCSKYRRQGMCRRLVIAIEEMLMSFEVEKIVVAAIPDLVKTWTEGFGFIPVEDSEKQSLNKINLMVFPGTVLLKKPLYDNQHIRGQSGDTSRLKANQSTKVDNRFCTAEPVEKFRKQLNENDIVECSKFLEFECGTSIKVIDGHTGVDGMSSFGVEEKTELGFNSGELVKFRPFYAAEFCIDAVSEPTDSKHLPTSEVCARTDEKTAEEQSNVHCHSIRVGAETESRIVQGNDLVEIGVVGAEVDSLEFLNPSDQFYCRLDVSAESEIRLEEVGHMQESEFGAKMQMFKPVQQESNGNGCANEHEVGLEGEVMQVGEAERISLQDHFSKLSCEDPAPKSEDIGPEMVSSVESLGMYDETQVSVDEQLKKACEVNVR